MLDHALRRVGPVVTRTVVNTHHHREQIEAHLQAGTLDVAAPLLSVEDEPGLGTAGAVAAAARLIDGDDVLIVNGDTWAPGDLTPVIESWDRERVRVVVAGAPVFGPRSQIVASLMPWISVPPLEVTPSGLYEVSWKGLADQGGLDVVGWDDQVIDCATPADLLAANMALSGGDSVIGAGAVVQGRVRHSLVWPGARVWPGEDLVAAIRTDGGVTVLVR